MPRRVDNGNGLSDGRHEEEISDAQERERVANRRLRRLYPQIRESESVASLPRTWDRYQCSDYLEVSNDGMVVTFTTRDERLRDDKDTSAIVRSDSAIPSSVGLYYFEVTILNGHRGCMGVGLSRREGSYSRMPGWDHNCYGYHGDDGNFFSACGHGVSYGPKFGTGDVVGCGIDTLLRNVFFTKNGEHLGVAVENIERIEDLYPTVGLKTPGEKVLVNFGQNPFLFDMAAYQETLFHRKMQPIEAVDLPDESERYMNRIVSSFLVHAGAVESLKLFEKCTKVDSKEDYQFLKQRTEIYNAIVNGEYGVKIETKLNQYFPGLLESQPHIHLLIMCLRFIDIAATIRRPPQFFEERTESVALELQKASTSTPYSRNSNKRGREKDEVPSTSSRKSTSNATPAKKSPISSRRAKNSPEVSKNGCTAPEKDQLVIVAESIRMNTTLQMFKENGEEVNKIKYLVELGRQILINGQIPSPDCDKRKAIIEISLGTIHKNRRITDPHPLKIEDRRFIANSVMELVNVTKRKGVKQYSELRGLFLAWKGLHTQMEKNDMPQASFGLMGRIISNGRKSTCSSRNSSLSYPDESGASSKSDENEQVVDSDEMQSDDILS